MLTVAIIGGRIGDATAAGYGAHPEVPGGGKRRAVCGASVAIAAGQRNTPSGSVRGISGRN